MATTKIIKKSTQCQNCGKSVSHGASDPAYELCYDCRKTLPEDDFELEVWYQITGQSRSVKEK